MTEKVLDDTGIAQPAAAPARPARLTGAIARPFAAGAHTVSTGGSVGDGGAAVRRALERHPEFFAPPRRATGAAADVPSADVSCADEEPTAPAVPLPPMLAARLAEAIVRPLSGAGHAQAMPGFDDLGDGAASAVRALAGHPGFHGPLNRAAARLSGMSDIVFDAHALLRVGHSSASDCALFLATTAPAVLEQAALHLGAIVLHRQLVGVALRREREALQRLLGEETYHVATREAPVLHAAFAALDDGSFIVPPAALGDRRRERRVANGIVAVGHRTLHGFVARIEPPLAPLLLMRRGRARAGGKPPGPAATSDTRMSDRHLAHIAKLLHRRFGPWQPITG